jgi:diamine N-acetyltransferase
MNPFLENETLCLRALEPEDLEILYQWENDASHWQYGNTKTPYSRFALREYLSQANQDLMISRQLRLMMVEKPEGRPVGAIDLYDFDPLNLRAGIGILVDEKARRQGLAFQALQLINDYAFNFLLLKQLYAYIPQSNEASYQLFLKSGYRMTGRLQAWLKTSAGFEDVYVMQHLALQARYNGK